MSDIIEGQVVDEEVGRELEPAATSTLFRTDDPVTVLRHAKRIAEELAPIVRDQGMYTQIGPKAHVQVEGWQTLGAMLGVTPYAVWTRKLHDPEGWEARVEARTLDGRAIGAAEAQCLNTEDRWRDAEDYARRSMAQTRATSKALSSVLRFVMTLGGFSGTPAEEMDGVRQGSDRSGAAIPPSDKQLDYLGNLLAKRDDVSAEDVPLMLGWAKANMSGGRGGSCSETIEVLKQGGQRAKNTVAALADKVVEWAAKQTDVPADTEGLEQQPQEEGLFPPEDSG